MSVIFEPLRDLVITEETPEEPYRRRAKEEKRTVHWGQLKLMMTEVHFLTTYWDPEKITNPVVVYAGAAPGEHLPFLSSMFPTFTFHLYDPRPFTIRATERLHLYQQYFTDEDAQRWSGRDDVFFISDIRTADHVTMKETENEEAIAEDMKRQAHWHEMIAPIRSMLKFRLPYTYEWAPKTMKYLAGTVYRQPWAPQTSTETRLVPDVPSSMMDWDIKKYESQLFYHNTIVREKFLYSNPYVDASQGLTLDYDSTAHAYILSRYISKIRKEEPTAALVLNLSRSLIRTVGKGTQSLIMLRSGGHKKYSRTVRATAT